MNMMLMNENNYKEILWVRVANTWAKIDPNPTLYNYITQCY